MPYTTLVAGTTITASWANASVRDQVVTPFASAAARDSAISSPIEGMLAYLSDTNPLTFYDGSSWRTLVAPDWATWTPTLTNLTQGNGTVVARYQQVGKTVNYWFKFTLGSTSAVGTDPQFTLPAAPSASYAANTEALGTGSIRDNSAPTLRQAIAWLVSGSNVHVQSFSGTGDAGNITATSPWTWATSDVLYVAGTYEAA